MSTVLFSVAQSIVFKLINDIRVKQLVVKLLEEYVSKTDNDIDNVIVDVVKTALLK